MSTLNKIGVVGALENLIKAAAPWSNETSVSKAINDAVEVLGYDPLNPVQYYEVSLTIDFEATSPEEAVKMYRELTETDRNDWVYTVKDESGEEIPVDTFNWDRRNSPDYYPKSLATE